MIKCVNFSKKKENEQHFCLNFGMEILLLNLAVFNSFESITNIFVLNNSIIRALIKKKTNAQQLPRPSLTRKQFS